MIDSALKFLAAEVNTYLQLRTGDPFGSVELGALVDDRGNWLVAQDTLRLSLFLIEEERTLREQLPERAIVGMREVVLPPQLKLNLIVVVAARFQQYAQALRHLSHVLTFLHSRPIFTPGSHPGMPAGLERLTAELVNYTAEQTNQMWGCIGTKQMPAVVYRLRVVVLQDVEPLRTGAPITTIAAQLGGR